MDKNDVIADIVDMLQFANPDTLVRIYNDLAPDDLGGIHFAGDGYLHDNEGDTE